MQNQATAFHQSSPNSEHRLHAAVPIDYVMSGIEEVIGKDHVVAAMKVLWSSRNGLSRYELLAITGMPAAKWEEMQDALDENLTENEGLITFGNDFLRQAVQDRYLTDVADQRAAHQQLAGWFEQQVMNKRAFLEIVWQWQVSGMSLKLVRNPDVLSTLSERERLFLEMRYGNKDGEEHTIDEISSHFKVPSERIRQIEAKAMRKIQHPTRFEKLYDFVLPWG